MDDPWKAEAEALIERLEPDHPAEFFYGLRDLIDQRFPRGRGRRKGDDLVDDGARLGQLVELLRAGMGEEDAVRNVARGPR
jgi:hypothetical protein